MKCPRCGTENPNNAQRCIHCGYIFTVNTQPTNFNQNPNSNPTNKTNTTINSSQQQSQPQSQIQPNQQQPMPQQRPKINPSFNMSGHFDNWKNKTKEMHPKTLQIVSVVLLGVIAVELFLMLCGIGYVASEFKELGHDISNVGQQESYHPVHKLPKLTMHI